MKGLRSFLECRFRVGRSLGFPFCGVPFFVKGLDHPQHKAKQREEDQYRDNRQFPQKRPNGGKDAVPVYTNQDAPP